MQLFFNNKAFIYKYMALQVSRMYNGRNIPECNGMMSLQQETKYWFFEPANKVFGPIVVCSQAQGTNESQGNCEPSVPLQSGSTGGLCAGVSLKLNMDIFTILDIYRFTEIDILRFMRHPRELIKRQLSSELRVASAQTRYHRNTE